MSDVLALQLALPLMPFAQNSRYYGMEIATIEIDGHVHSYVRRRFLPQPERMPVIGEHAVVAGERPDHIAARAFGDPLLFWRLCDANRVMRPDELTETLGRRIVITLPEGVPGLPNV